jgi:iron-sulfur cluster assembly protein
MTTQTETEKPNGASPAASATARTPSIDVSPQAVEAVARQMKKRGTLEASLRLGIRGGGCSGFSYVIEFHDGRRRSCGRGSSS